MKLNNLRWEAFCIEFARSGNACEAYRKAGYSAKKNGTISAAVTRLLKMLA